VGAGSTDVGVTVGVGGIGDGVNVDVASGVLVLRFGVAVGMAVVVGDGILVGVLV
jgi:hypothetical protein